MREKHRCKTHTRSNREGSATQYNSFVAAVGPADQSSVYRRPSPTADATAIAIIPSSVHTSEPLQGREGATEKTTGLDRSIALVVRLLPFSGIWLVLATGVAWTFALGSGVGFVLFALLTAFTYYYMDRQEREFSRNGLERHRIDTLALLKLAEMEHQQQLRKMALEAHLKLLGDNHATTS